VLLLVADEVAAGDDLLVDQAAEFAEVAVILGAAGVMEEDEVVDVVEGDVEHVKQMLALRAHVIAEGVGRVRGVLAGMRHKRSVSTQPEWSWVQNKVGRS
jgi:hypothetical protein